MEVGAWTGEPRSTPRTPAGMALPFRLRLSLIRSRLSMRLSDRPRVVTVDVVVDRGRADRGEPETRHRRRSASLSSLHTRLTECDGTRQEPPPDHPRRHGSSPVIRDFAVLSRGSTPVRGLRLDGVARAAWTELRWRAGVHGRRGSTENPERTVLLNCNSPVIVG